MAAATSTEGGNKTEKNELSREEQIASLSEDYAKYLEINADSEVNSFGDSIEEMLTQLDEYCGLVDIIRSDSSLCLNRTLPEIYKKCQEMEKIFEKIDKLEAYVALVRKTVDEMEKDIDKAESEMGSLSTFKKVLGSFSLPGFFSSSKSQPAKQPVPSTVPFSPAEVFSTDSFISYGADKREPSPVNENSPQSPSSNKLSVNLGDKISEGEVCETNSDTDRKDSGISVTASSSQETNSPESEGSVTGGTDTTAGEVVSPKLQTDTNTEA